MSRILLCCDFDGTIKPKIGGVPSRTVRAMRRVRSAGGIVCIATGRSLYSFERARGFSLPIDYLVFSSGAGIWDCRKRALIHKEEIGPERAGVLAEALKRERFDFCVHKSVPENHWFSFHSTGEANPDFDRRLGWYKDFGSPLSEGIDGVSQFLVIAPQSQHHREESLRRFADELSVVRTTSPIDGRSIWWEIFPPGVHKASGCDRIRMIEGIDSRRIIALGNDYNDEALLEWAPNAFVTSNAPANLRSRFSVVPGPMRSGLVRALKLWDETHG